MHENSVGIFLLCNNVRALIALIIINIIVIRYNCNHLIRPMLLEFLVAGVKADRRPVCNTMLQKLQ